MILAYVSCVSLDVRLPFLMDGICARVAQDLLNICSFDWFSFLDVLTLLKQSSNERNVNILFFKCLWRWYCITNFFILDFIHSQLTF